MKFSLLTRENEDNLYWLYRWFGIPAQGYFAHEQKVWYYEKSNGLVDIYSIKKNRLVFFHTISMGKLRQYLTGKKKVYPSMNDVMP